MKKVEVRIAGSGGQGVVLAGQILGRAVVYDRKNAVQTQSYGAEARGSATKSEVIISDDKIGFPIVRKCDVLIAMNQEALDKYLKDLKENGILIADTTNIKKIPETQAKVFNIPATEYAEETFGAKIYANMLMLGAFTKITNLVSEKAMQEAIADAVTEKVIKINEEAYRKGKALVQ